MSKTYPNATASAGPGELYKTFREAVMNAVYSPFRKARDLLKGMPTGAAGLRETIWALKDVSLEVQPGHVVGTGFHPELTGRENTYLNGAIMGMRRTEIDRKFDETVAFSEVEKFIDTPVTHYSSGMYVRSAFAVAAHLDPEILLVDEVLAVGDAEFQKNAWGRWMTLPKRAGRSSL